MYRKMWRKTYSILRKAVATIALGVVYAVAFSQVTADFLVSATTGCGNTTIEFDDISKGSPQKWIWDFGNGVVKNETRSKSYKFTFQPGTYTVSLQVWNGDNHDEKSIVITIYEEPIVDFELTSFSGCVGSEALFEDKSTSNYSIVKYKWRFGDAGISTLRKPKHTFLTEGDYSVSLAITDENGCSAEKVKNGYVHVTDLLQFNLNADVAEVCKAPLTTQLSTNCSETDVESYLWDFGDGTISQEAEPTHTYSQDGMYTVTVTAKAPSGCPTIRTFEKAIKVNAHTATIISPDTICYGENAAISVEASIPIASCDWNFGDGATNENAGLTTSHIFKTSGNQTITATVYGEEGCERTTTKQIFVRPMPNITMTADKQHSCDDGEDMTVTFGVGEAQSYQWEFGDGSVSSESSPVHTYSTAGLYDVSLTIIDEHGCVGHKTEQRFITKTNPVADFVVTDQYTVPHLCINKPLTITNTSSSVVNITDVQWEYLYDRSVETENTTDMIQYNQGGEYPIKITVTDEFGCTDSKTNVLKIGDVSQVKAKVIAPTTYKFCPNVDVVFKSQESAGATDWNWIITNQSTGTKIDTVITSTSLTMNFEESGRYSVLLIAYQYACPSTSIGTTSITVNPPTANFTYSPKALCSFPSTISFDPSTSVSAESYMWDFGDGTRIKVEPNATEGHYKVTDLNTSTILDADADTYIVSHEYTTPNTYSVTLTTYNGSCEDAITIPLNTSGISVSVEQDVTEICQGGEVRFTDVSLVESGTATTRTWTFSDGTASETVDTDEITHTFAQAGTYNVELEVVSSTGCSDTKVFNSVVTVYSNPTIQSFSTDNATGCADLTVHLSSQAQAEGTLKISSYIWSYGDGLVDTTKTNASPVHRYKKGSYNPTVQVIDQLGCTSVSEPITITATFPTPDFSIPEAICHDDELQPENHSEGVELQALWTWGDGSESITGTHTYTVSEPMDFTVKLTVTDKNNCTDSKKKTISLRYPQADFYAIDNKTVFDCPPANASFKNNSQAEHATYLWNFGENSAVSLSIPDSAFWQYQQVGTYDVTLVVKDNIGCTSSLVKSEYITVNGPTGKFKIEPESGCTYSDISMVAYDVKDVMQYSWVFGDGQFQNTTTDNVTYSYPDGNYYVPSLTIIDEEGCEISMIGDTVTIYGVTPDFEGDTLICDGDVLKINDLSEYSPEKIDSWKWTFSSDSYTKNVEDQHISTTLQPGIYSVQLQTTVKNCTYKKVVPAYVDIHRKPQVSIGSSNETMTICDFTSMGVEATILSGDDGNGPFEAKSTWSGNGVVADGKSILKAIFTANSYDDNSVLFDYTSTYGCELESPVTKSVTVNPVPQKPNSATMIYCWENKTFDWRSLVSSASGIVSWYDSDLVNLPSYPSLMVYDAGSYIYYATITKNDCESEKSEMKLTVYPLPEPEIISSNDSVCQGTAIQLGVNDLYESYAWSCPSDDLIDNPTDASPNFVESAAAGTYSVSVVVEDENGCSNTSEAKELTILPIPVVDFEFSKKAVEIFEDMEFINKIDTVNNSKPVVWTWTIGDKYTGNEYSVPFVFSEEGTIEVSLEGYIYEACKNTVTKPFLIMPTVRIPNVFTPNGDGVNDVFFDGMPETELIIINRWGQELYKGMGGWDGTYNGNEMSAGTYFYIITLPNGDSYNGPVLLMRN